MRKTTAFLLMLVLVMSLCACGAGQSLKDEVSTGEQETEFREFVLGSVSGTTYESDSMGLGYRLNDGWTFFSDEEIRQRNNVAAEITGDEYEKLMQEAEVVIDMMAADETELDNINVNFAKVQATPAEMLLLDLTEVYKENLRELRSMYEAMGCQNIDDEIIRVSVDGKQVDAYRITAEINGVQMFQLGFQRKCKEHMATVTVTTFFEDNISRVLENLYWL